MTSEDIMRLPGVAELLTDGTDENGNGLAAAEAQVVNAMSKILDDREGIKPAGDLDSLSNDLLRALASFGAFTLIAQLDAEASC